MGTFPGLLLIFQAPQNFNLTGAISGAAGRALPGCSRVALCYSEIMTDRTGRVALVSYANEGINQNRKIIH